MIDFDTNLALDGGVCSFAGRQKGKTNLFKLLVNELMKSGITVKVFDPSQAWTRNTPVHDKITVRIDQPMDLLTESSIIYDISRLTRPDQRTLVNSIIAEDYNTQANTPEELRQPKFYVMEEAQLFASSQSVKWLEEVYKLVSVGANFKMSYGLISQRPASIDTECISRCSQIFIGNLWEENDLRKVKNYLNYSRTECYEVITHLPVGCFVKVQDGKKKIVSVPEFRGPNAIELRSEKPSLVQTLKSLIRI